MKRMPRRITLVLPAEFIALCQRDKIEPDFVLRGFIADLCGLIDAHADPRNDGYCSNGSSERDKAYAYYERVGYPWWHST